MPKQMLSAETLAQTQKDFDVAREACSAGPGSKGFLNHIDSGWAILQYLAKSAVPAAPSAPVPLKKEVAGGAPGTGADACAVTSALVPGAEQHGPAIAAITLDYSDPLLSKMDFVEFFAQDGTDLAWEVSRQRRVQILGSSLKPLGKKLTTPGSFLMCLVYSA